MTGVVSRTILVFLIGSVVLLTSACQYYVDFVLVNESDAPVVIKYSLVLSDYLSPGRDPSLAPPQMVPHQVALSEWKSGVDRNGWEKGEIPRYSFELRTGDSKTARVELKIPPRTATLVFEGSGRLDFEDGYKDFPLKQISIEGQNGAVAIEGEQLFHQFSKGKGSGRSITYY